MSTKDYSLLYALFRDTRVVHRESFTIATFDPATYKQEGVISAHDFAHEILRALDRCQEDEGACHVCGPDETTEEERAAEDEGQVSVGCVGRSEAG